jgi:hypothetical protein
MGGARYAQAVTSHIAVVIDGLVGLETVGLHVSKELYGYVGIAGVGLSYRTGSFEFGPQAGVTYSSVPSYDADIGPNPAGLMTSVGLAADFRW